MSNLVKWDPFAELSALQKQFFGDDWMSPLKGVNIPTTDVFTKDNNLVVEAHLPNFEQKDVNIEVENGTLVISAERHEKRKIKASNTLCVKAQVASTDALHCQRKQTLTESRHTSMTES